MTVLNRDGTPANTVPLCVTSANGANTAVSATLGAVAGATNYIEAVIISGAGATLGSIVEATITGLSGGTISMPLSVPAGALLGMGPTVIRLPRPIRATADNTAIVVTLPALGVGSLNARVTAICFVG
jgi:hypothetical protein